MKLLENQIQHLFVWVHPDNNSVSQGVLDDWKTLVELLASDHPEMQKCALVQSSRGISFQDLDLSEVKKPIKSYTAGSATRKQYEELAFIEALAEEELGDRYLRWEHGNFIDGGIPGHLQTLRDKFNVTDTQYKKSIYSLGTSPRPFRTILAYGLKPSACVEAQLSKFGGYSHIAAEGQNLWLVPVQRIMTTAPRKGSEIKDELDQLFHVMSKIYIKMQETEIPTVVR